MRGVRNGLVGPLGEEVLTDVGVGQRVRGRESAGEERSEEGEVGTHAVGITDELLVRSTGLKKPISVPIALYTRRVPQLFLSPTS